MEKRERGSSSIVSGNLPCPIEGCKSSDAYALYDDGHGYCFSCERSTQPKSKKENEEVLELSKKNKEDKKKIKSFADAQAIKEIKEEYQCRGFIERLIKKNIAEFYDCRVSFNEAGDLDTHYYPYHSAKSGVISGYKCRKLPKKFWSHGNVDNLFGQAHFPAGSGRKLIITEGELDAMAIAQANYERYERFYPVVSLPKGAKASEQDVINNLSWIRSFNEVVLFYDDDEKGQEAAKDHARIIGIDKCKIVMNCPEKDASALLLKEGPEAVRQAVWEAEEWTPANIMDMEELWEEMVNFSAKESIPYPTCMGQLNSKLKGRRTGEITTWISGTGAGKTTLIREIINYTRENTEDSVGIIALEENPGETARKLCAVYMSKNLAEEDVTAEEMKPAFDFLFKENRIRILNHFDSEGSLMSTMEHMALMGCKWIVLDHITLFAAETSDGRNENAHVDKIMNDMRRLVKQRDVHLDIVSQLRKMGDSGKSFEDGVMPTLDDIKGSGSIKQCSWNVIGFARNLNAENDLERNTIKLAVLKCRLSGLTGPLPPVYYSYATNRILREAPDEYSDPEVSNYGIKRDVNGDISKL